MKFPMTIEIDGEEIEVDKTYYKDFLDIVYKDDFDMYKEEMKDEWKYEKESEEDVPPFAKWFEAHYEYTLNFKNWMEQQPEEEILQELTQYIEDNPEDWEDD